MQYAKRLILFYCFLPFCVFANVFVMGDSQLLNTKTFNLINQIGSEFFEKSGVGVYVILKETPTENRMQRKALALEKLQDVKGSYFAISFASQDKKIDFFMSEDLEGMIDVDGIYRRYMIPFLPINKSDVLDVNRISSIVLNGYAYFIDALAEYKKVQLDSNIVDKNGELLAKIARFAIQIMLAILVGVFVWFYIIRRKS